MLVDAVIQIPDSVSLSSTSKYTHLDGSDILERRRTHFGLDNWISDAISQKVSAGTRLPDFDEMKISHCARGCNILGSHLSMHIRDLSRNDCHLAFTWHCLGTALSMSAPLACLFVSTFSSTPHDLSLSCALATSDMLVIPHDLSKQRTDHHRQNLLLAPSLLKAVCVGYLNSRQPRFLIRDASDFV